MCICQESVLGPRVFVQYAEDVDDIFRRHRVHHHLFADDMQGYCSGRLNDISTIVSRLENCIDIYAWCGAKRLQLNADKTELLWFGPASQLRQLPSQNSTIHVNQCVDKPVTVVRDLGASESCTQQHAPFWISSRVTVWLQLFKSCTGLVGGAIQVPQLQLQLQLQLLCVCLSITLRNCHIQCNAHNL